MLQTTPASRRAFTLTELMVAITMLVAILLAASKIFSTTARVSSVGEANADVLLDVGALERQIRQDFEQLSREGVFAIRCVAVRNDVNGAFNLLNPTLPGDATIRCDQMLFFKNAEHGVQTFIAGSDFPDAERRGRGLVSRIYYGHGFQLGNSGQPMQVTGPVTRAYDANEIVVPWEEGSIATTQTLMDGGGVFQTVGSGSTTLVPTDAREWIFMRHPALLVDDGGQITQYLQDIRTARSLFLNDPVLGSTTELQKGRVDAAGMTMKEFRERMLYEDPTVTNPVDREWQDAAQPGQYELIRDQLLFYPRGERYAPSMHRVDQALTGNIILNACSSVTIDWTYSEGTGEIRDEDSGVLFYKGVTYDESNHRWFGFSDNDVPRIEDRRGVYRYGELDVDDLAPTILPNAIEEWGGALEGAQTYTAIFGFNQQTALDNTGNPNIDLGYTPWPSAIRVTVTAHDAGGTLEAGRPVQFVLELPRRHVR